MSRRDAEAFADFVAARSGALHRAAYLMVGDAQLAQDLVQEALTKTYVAWPRLRDPSRVEAYTRKAITTTAITWFRRKGWNNERPTETLPEGGSLGHAEAVADRTAMTLTVVYPDRATRDGWVASGMTEGLGTGYVRLDAVLAEDYNS